MQKRMSVADVAPLLDVKRNMPRSDRDASRPSRQQIGYSFTKPVDAIRAARRQKEHLCAIRTTLRTIGRNSKRSDK